MPPAVRQAIAQPARIGTANWAIPRNLVGAFPREGAVLERYAARVNAVEINSSFYRSHRPHTYARWRALTPPDFRFAIKLPRSITHEARLVGAEDRLVAFRAEAAQLEEKLGPLLVQLPPSLAFSPSGHAAFFADLRDLWPEPVVCEPRHASWFEPEAEALLRAYRIGRVAVDPAPHPLAAKPGGWPGVGYWRWHGSPRMYYSGYDSARLAELAREARATADREIWCVFDNTVLGAATANALSLLAMLGAGAGLGQP